MPLLPGDSHAGCVSSGVTEAILLHRDGTFLARYPLLAPSPVEWAAQARALLDMMAAVDASFGPGTGGLRELEFGDTTLRVDVSPQLVLVTIVSGRVRPALVRRLADLLVDLELNYRTALANWKGRAEDLVGVDKFLRGLVAGH